MRLNPFLLSLAALGGMCLLFAPRQTWSQVPAMSNAGQASALPDAPESQVPSLGEQALNAAQPPAKAGSSEFSPPSGDVSGTVTDVNGGVVPGATVSLEGSQRATRQSQTANDNGFFE